MRSGIAEIEHQFVQLPLDAQRQLLERLHRISERVPAWDNELSKMAADEDIQRELKRIEAEFRQADSDGLESR